MGKATITGGGVDGLYNVQMQYSDEYYEAIKKMKQKQITDIEKRQDALEIDIAALEDETDNAIHQYQLVVDAYAEALKLAAQIGEKVPAADYNYAEWYDYARTTSINLGTRRRQYEANKIQLATLRMQLEAIEAKKNADAKGVWCADFIEDAEGDCGIIDIPGEPGEQIMQPQYQGAGAYSAGRDGILMPRAWPSPASAYYNFAILPGIQRWRPTYRLGTLIDIDYDNNSGEVELMAAISSAQSLNVNPPNTLLTVQFAYMECNAEAFEVGDAVVVKLEGDWENPLVIGFRKNPQPCPVKVEYLVEDGLEITPLELATQRVKKGENTEPVTASVIPGMDWVKFWKWDDELTEDTRSEEDVQVPLAFTAKAIVFPREIAPGKRERKIEFDYEYLLNPGRPVQRSGNSIVFVPSTMEIRDEDPFYSFNQRQSDVTWVNRITITYDMPTGVDFTNDLKDVNGQPILRINFLPWLKPWEIYEESYYGTIVKVGEQVGNCQKNMIYGGPTFRPSYYEEVSPGVWTRIYFGEPGYYSIEGTWDQFLRPDPREGHDEDILVMRGAMTYTHIEDIFSYLGLGDEVQELFPATITITHEESGISLVYQKEEYDGQAWIYRPIPGS